MNGLLRNPLSAVRLFSGILARQRIRVASALFLSCVLHFLLLAMAGPREFQYLAKSEDRHFAKIVARVTAQPSAYAYPELNETRFLEESRPEDSASDKMAKTDHVDQRSRDEQGFVTEERFSDKEKPAPAMIPEIDVQYYPVERLTVKPLPLGELIFESDEMADEVSRSKIVLSLWINNEGKVIALTVESPGISEAISQAVDQAFRKLRFLPGEMNGKKAGAVMRVGVEQGERRLLLDP